MDPTETIIQPNLRMLVNEKPSEQEMKNNKARNIEENLGK